MISVNCGKEWCTADCRYFSPERIKGAKKVDFFCVHEDVCQNAVNLYEKYKTKEDMARVCTGK